MGWVIFSPADREAARLLNDLMGWRPRDEDETSDEEGEEQASTAEDGGRENR